MTVVLANGVFDLLHYGHLLHLEAASRLGDILVVAVTSDAHVYKPGRPIRPAYERAALVGALRCVDQVLVVDGLLDALQKVDVDIVVKGRDYARLEPAHAAYCKSHGIEIAFTDTPKYSTSDEIRRCKRL